MTSDYENELNIFNKKAHALGYRDLANYYWYHTIDLGKDLVTPGFFDYRHCLADFHFPCDMAGMKVLDIGSATGFFAFEFEKRGAIVTSVDISSLDEIDLFPGENIQQLIKKLEKILNIHTGQDIPITTKMEQLYQNLIDGPFKFCHKVLNSKVQRCYSSIYHLSPDKLLQEQFDLVFIGDLLLHTINPLQALAAVVPFCKDRLIISQKMPDMYNLQPTMVYVGGEEPGSDNISWWLPNRACFEQLLKKLGFKSVIWINPPRARQRPEGIHLPSVMHASKRDNYPDSNRLIPQTLGNYFSTSLKDPVAFKEMVKLFIPPIILNLFRAVMLNNSNKHL